MSDTSRPTVILPPHPRRADLTGPGDDLLDPPALPAAPKPPTPLHDALALGLARVSTLATELGRRVPRDVTSAHAPYADRLVDGALADLMRAGVALGVIDAPKTEGP